MTTNDQRLQRDTAYRVVALAMNGHKLDLTPAEWREFAQTIVSDRRKSKTAIEKRITTVAAKILAGEWG